MLTGGVWEIQVVHWCCDGHV